MERSCFTPDEFLVLDAYFAGLNESDAEVATACDRLDVPSEVHVRRIDDAVGQILIQGIQRYLPNYGVSGGHSVVLGRDPRPVSDAAAQALEPRHLFTINWADSGPGISWPEAYHAVPVPGFGRIVVVASQDGPDMWGCTDQALGHFDASLPLAETAGEILRDYWSNQYAEYNQYPWAYLFDEGLVDRSTAESWREAVWGSGDEEGES